LAQWVAFFVFLTFLLGLLDRDVVRAKRIAFWRQSVQNHLKMRDVGRGVWSIWKREANLCGKSMRHAIGVSVVVGILGAVFLGVGLEEPLLAPFGGIAIGLYWLRVRQIKAPYEKYQTRIRRALFDEAVPIASHSLKATGKVEVAIAEIAKIAKNKAIRELFAGVAETWKQKSLTPAEALYRAAVEYDVEELQVLATMTKESAEYEPDFAEIWLGYRGQRMQLEFFRKRVEARTRTSKTNALVFAGGVGGLLLLAYPRVQPYLTPETRIGFWVVLAIMVASGVSIHRIAKNTNL
jgi:hypothetical protein